MLLNNFYKIFQKNFCLKDKLNLVNLILGLIILAATFACILYKIKIYQSEKLLFLHYNIYFGIDWIGKWYGIFAYPFIGTLIFIVNAVLAIIFYAKDKIISYILTFSAIFLELLILLSVLSVIWINS